MNLNYVVGIILVVVVLFVWIARRGRKLREIEQAGPFRASKRERRSIAETIRKRVRNLPPGFAVTLIMIGYALFPFAVIAAEESDVPGWLLAILSIPIGLIGLLMQILPCVYLTDVLVDRGVDKDKASNLVMIAWIIFLIAYWAGFGIYFAELE